MKKTAVVQVRFGKSHIERDIEIPLDISVNDLIRGLNTAYDLKIDVDDIRNCYIKMENPIALMRGNKLLYEYGMHDCSIINLTEA